MRLLAVLLGFLMSVSTTQVWSFVRSSPSGFPISWNSNCLSMSLSSAGSEDISLGVLEAAISDSMEPWNDLSCSGVELIYDGTTSSGAVGFSNDGPNENLIVFQDDLGDWIYQPDILALTTLTFCSAQGGLCEFRGQILDGDIEFNGREEPFSASEEPMADHHDFANTLTHELGHFIGLDHSLDSVSTMYFSAPIEEIEKRTLDADDEAGFCAIYSSCSIADDCSRCRDFDGGDMDIDPNPDDEELSGCSFDLGSAPGRDMPILLWTIFLYCVLPRRSRK